MENSKWTTDNIPDLNGKTIIITGATSGLGKQATKVLARKNANVIMAVRNTSKGENVRSEILNEYPEGTIRVEALDLSNLESIHQFAKRMKDSVEQVDILINNAGVMMSPYSTTKDGFELQMGTNHLGPFALTGLLMPLLRKAPNSRIVNTSSQAHRQGEIDFNDIQWEKRKYKTMKAYSDSKLANLLFTYELVDKLKDDEYAPVVTAAHPGWTRTDLQRHSGLFQFLNNFFSQGVEMGVMPTLRAAFDNNAQSGDYFGPKGWGEMKGDPVKVSSNEKSHDKGAARRLWDASEKFTKISY